MAYAALVSFEQTLDQILNHGHYSISLLQKQQFDAVHRCAILLREFLDDFPEKAQILEGRIRDVAYEAEDTNEFLEREHLHQGRQGYHFSNLEKFPKIIKSMAGQVMNIKQHFRRHRIRRGYYFPDLENLTKKIQSIAEQVMSIKSSFTIKDDQQLVDLPFATSSGIAPTVVVGFDDDLIAIKARLHGESSHLQIIPIVGMGGIGKTTLARNAFDDQLIMEYFDIRVWVTVSQDYHAHEILSGLLVSIQEINTEKSAQRNGSVEERVYKSLKGWRYLIVMDDLWCTEAWDDLKQIFPDDGNGSRIVLTSRLAVVASYPDPCAPLYEMRLMNADRSWDLLRHKLFMHKDCPPELEHIGKKIASSCRGLPLAIVVIAGILSMVGKTPTSWGNIADNVNSIIATKDGHLEKILSLSYNHLPHHLRSCFLYMGSFPEDYEIRVSKLVKIWVAEGFLIRKNVSKSLEEEAEEYLEDLVKRSLIYVRKRKSNRKIKSCRVHDLVRDLCIRKAREEKFFLNAEKILPKNVENQRRLSVSHFKKDCLAGNYDSTIRTIQCFHCDEIEAISLGNYKLLRVLVAEYTKFKRLTDESIGFALQACKLFQLRYLDLFYANHLLIAITNLQNLQTLIVHAWETSRDYPASRVHLPSVIWRMPQLRHLISYFFEVSCKGFQTLRNWGSFYMDMINLNPVFPATLKKLTLSGWRLPWEGITVVGSLPSLEVLKLRDFACKGRTWETTEGEFPGLKFLLIDKSDLQHWITESSHFPRLQSLLVRRCWCLAEIPTEIGEILTLELIDVDSGNKSVVESAKRIQEEQQSWGNDVLQVRWVRS